MKKILYLLIINFILFVGYFLFSDSIFFPFAAVLGVLLFLLGVYFIYLTKISKKKKNFFFYLTGISAAATFPSGVLHNLFYSLTGIEEGFLLIIATIIAPVAFIVGVIGTFMTK